MIPRRLMNNDKIVTETINESTILNECKGSYFNGIDVYGKSTQITTKGYQLFDSSKIPTKSQGGATVTNNGDGSFTISGSGTLTENYSNEYMIIDTSIIKKILKEGILKVKNVGSAYSMPFFGVSGYDSKEERIFALDADRKTFTLTNEIINNITKLVFNFWGQKGLNIESNTVSPIVYQEGDGTFEPYTGGKPSPNPEYPQPINSVGGSNNLFPILEENFVTIDGLKSVINFDGSITVTGTPTKQNAKATKDISLNLPVGKYYINGGETDVGNILFQLRITYNDGTSNSYPNKTTFSVTDKVASVDGFLIYTSQNLRPVNYTIYPMLNKGDKPLPFEKYMDSIEINSSGGNLFKPYSKYNNEITWTVNSDGSIHIKGTNTSNKNMYAIFDFYDKKANLFNLPNGEYYISGIPKNINENNLKCWIQVFAPLNGDNSSTVKDTGDGASFIFKRDKSNGINQNIAIGVAPNVTIDTIIYPMLNVGSAPLPFEPYKPKQTLSIKTPNGLPGIPLSDDNTDITPTYIDKDGKKWVCDEIDLGRGKYVQRVKKETGLVFKKATFNDKLYECVIPEWNFVRSYRPVICDHLKYNINLINVNKTGTYAYGNSIRAKFKDSQDDTTNINNLKTYTFMYILDNPVKYDLTPEEITAYKSVHTYVTNTTITSEPNVSMNVTYRKLRN